jgi:signal transduction histidine kinase
VFSLRDINLLNGSTIGVQSLLTNAGQISVVTRGDLNLDASSIAAFAGNDGGSITLSGRQVGQEIRSAASDHVEGKDFVELIVADTGIGIDRSEQDRIFEQFYEVRDPRLHSTSKTDFMGGGAGLGLAITRGVAEAHGGWVWVESEGYDPDSCPGSRFHVVLPVGAPPK